MTGTRTKNWLKQQGAALVEYALLVALISLVGAVSAKGLGQLIGGNPEDPSETSGALNQVGRALIYSQAGPPNAPDSE